MNNAAKGGGRSAVVRWVSLGVVSAALSVMPAASAFAEVIQAVDSGFYGLTLEDNGVHDPANTSYPVGRDGFDENRNFFVFDLPLHPHAITGAQLLIFNPQNGYDSVHSAETYAVFDVSTPVSELTVGGNNRNMVYVDLGSGVAYGSVEVSEEDEGGFLTVSLSAGAIERLNQIIGLFAVGGALTSVDGTAPQLAFLSSSLDSNVLLSLTRTSVVAEPPAAALLGCSLLGLIAWRPRQTRHRTKAMRVTS